MRKRRVYLGLLTLAGAAIVASIVAGALRDREPEYEGKTLSEWVEMMEDWPLVEFNGYYDGPPDDHPVHRALSGIGTNAVPYLLRWISYERPAWKTKLYQLLKLGDEKAFRVATASAALCVLARDVDGSALLSVFSETNANIRGLIPIFVKQLGANTPPAVPALRQLLNDSDPAIRALAATKLEKFDPEVLEKGLNGEYSGYTAGAALNGLGSYGLPPLLSAATNSRASRVTREWGIWWLGRVYLTNQAIAAAGLSNVLADPDFQLRSAATNSLEELIRRGSSRVVRPQSALPISE